jgi:hypothetical protein
MDLIYQIGAYYRYPKGSVFQLKEVKSNGMLFIFDKNHWCTDNVFRDLIQVNANNPNQIVLAL